MFDTSTVHISGGLRSQSSISLGVTVIIRGLGLAGRSLFDVLYVNAITYTFMLLLPSYSGDGVYSDTLVQSQKIVQWSHCLRYTVQLHLNMSSKSLEPDSPSVSRRP